MQVSFDNLILSTGIITSSEYFQLFRALELFRARNLRSCIQHELFHSPAFFKVLNTAAVFYVSDTYLSGFCRVEGGRAKKMVYLQALIFSFTPLAGLVLPKCAFHAGFRVRTKFALFGLVQVILLFFRQYSFL